MHRIVEVKPALGYVLEVEFSDGAFGKVDLSDRLFGPMFEPLLDPNVFNQVQIDEYGAICWPNGADLAPDALYQKIQGESGGTEQAPMMHLQDPEDADSSLCGIRRKDSMHSLRKHMFLEPLPPAAAKQGLGRYMADPVQDCPTCLAQAERRGFLVGAQGLEPRTPSV
ncbi:MAG: DUF2442 domain-containing protein [Bryobacteraceae bacterium]